MIAPNILYTSCTNTATDMAKAIACRTATQPHHHTLTLLHLYPSVIFTPIPISDRLSEPTSSTSRNCYTVTHLHFFTRSTPTPPYPHLGPTATPPPPSPMSLQQKNYHTLAFHAIITSKAVTIANVVEFFRNYHNTRLFHFVSSTISSLLHEY